MNKSEMAENLNGTPWLLCNLFTPICIVLVFLIDLLQCSRFYPPYCDLGFFKITVVQTKYLTYLLQLVKVLVQLPQQFFENEVSLILT
jgi:hypothetical protein